MSEGSRQSRKRKCDELDPEFLLQKFTEFSSSIRQLKKAQRHSFARRNSPANRRSFEKKTKNRKTTREQCENNCCCPRAAKRFRGDRNDPEHSTDDERLAEALKNDDTGSNELSTGTTRDNRPFVDEWIRIAKESISANELKILSAKYQNDENRIAELKAPRLNDGLRHLVNSAALQIDEAYALRQNQIASMMTTVAKALAMIVRKGKQSSGISTLVETLNDVGRCNAEIHNAISVARRRSIIAAFDVDDLDDRSDVSEQLFSLTMDRLLWQRNFMDTMKKYFASEREELQKSRCKTKNRATQTLHSREIQTQMSQETQTEVPPATLSERMEEVPQSTQIVATTRATLQCSEAETNTEETRNPKQETVVPKERVVAKIEGTPVAKEDSRETIMPGVPSPNENYPGDRELVRRALIQRGVPHKYPNVSDSTWKRWGKHLLSWWSYCRRTRTNVAEPTEKDVVQYFKMLQEAGQSVGDCRPALRRVIPDEIATHKTVMNFYAKVKAEKKG